MRTAFSRLPIAALTVAFAVPSVTSGAENPTAACTELTVSDPLCDQATEGSGEGGSLVTPQDVPLPFTGVVTSSIPGFEVKQDGNGISGRFEIRSQTSAAIALDGVSAGTGHALLAWNLGRGRGAVVITSNPANTLPTLDVSGLSAGSAADIRLNNTATTSPAVSIATLGNGLGLLVNHKGEAGGLATFQLAGENMVRFTRLGKGIFKGGTQTGGADLAEAFEVEGAVGDYTPGDVLVISERTDRRVAWSDGAYSTRVVGVHATRPGVLLTDRDVDDDLQDMIPVGVVGILPTRVTAENGPIRRGDLLVTAATPGHAMRGTDRERMLGAVIGKALAEFSGEGTGLIPVLVNVK